MSDGTYELRKTRHLLADIDRRVYTNDELIRMARSGHMDTRSAEERETAIANYMAENNDLEETTDELRYLIALHERTQQEERQRARAAWPIAWQVAAVMFAGIVLFLFALSVLRL